MAPDTIKRLYALGMLVWCAGLGIGAFCAVRGIVSGPTLLVSAGIYALLYLGSYGWLRRTGRL